MDVFIEILNVYKTVSQLLSERSVFIAVTVLIFLNLAPDICPAYNTNQKLLKLNIFNIES